MMVHLKGYAQSAIDSTLVIAICIFSHVTPYEWYWDLFISVWIIVLITVNVWLSQPRRGIYPGGPHEN